MLATLGVVLAANALFAGVLVSLVAPWLRPPLRGAGLDAGLAPWAVSLWWLPLVVGFLGVTTWLQLRYVRRETLAAVDARVVTPEERPALHARLTRLASQAATPVPALAVVETPVPNSFALDGFGRPTVVVSEGLVETLDDDGLDAVLAHELAHLENRDATVMTLASFLPALTSDRYSLLAALGDWTRSRAVWVAGLAACYLLGAVATGANPFDGGYAARFAGALVLTVVVAGVALGVFATLTAVAARRLAQYREFAADRGGAALTGDPAALAETLRTLDDGGAATPRRDKRLAYGPVHGLCLLPHGFNPAADWADEFAGDGSGNRDGHGGGDGHGGRDGHGGSDGPVGDGDEFHVETRTHPPTAERVARLRDLVDG